ncbi:cytochrome P450 [Caulobacter sp. FWC2]|jgi:cytochrome P450|uniref:cytochrome P450 n=1 Tax=Caulobacter sp. FWC2 TaxID=69664 RepID=UPI000C154C25|nr:cytochrome P450 [Caulobacter sp. FWC2]PIB89867.1 cytochrome P450 [Caulobacter sp. FWC2]PIB90066.1 cytochrome P450 [Caulobacter sp. FWC2]
MSTAQMAPNKDLADGFAQVGALFAGNDKNLEAIYRHHRNNLPVMEGDICAELGAASFAGQTGRPIYTIFKHADVMKVLRDTKTFTSGILMETGLGPFLDGLMITGLDGDEHRQLRGILQPSFTPAVMEEWRETYIRPLIKRSFVEPLVPLGKAELIGSVGVMFPIHVVYAVLGFQDDDPAALEAFATKALKVLGGMANDPEAKRAAFQAFQELYDPTLAAVQARRASGAEGADLISRLIRAEFEGRTLNDHQITNFVRMMLPAASETTSRTFAIMMTHLFDHPEVLERLRADRTLMRKVLDESVRHDAVATFKVRECQTEVTLQDVTIPKGAIISACVASANRDEAVFDNPDAFDIDRKQMAAFGFGFGAHMCVGMWLAKVEIEEAVGLLLDMLPNLRLDPAHPRPEVRGVSLRGPDAVHVVWDAP